MIDRRKIIVASLAGVFLPVCAVLAQPAHEERKDAHPDDHAPERPHADDHVAPHPAEHMAAVRPHMPPLRHENRPRPPGPEASYHWRAGHWNWDGRQWVWISGVWFR
jgi:hypothetical protein